MSWWSDQGGAGYSVISLTTVGDQQEAPHHHMPGGVTGAVRDVSSSDEALIAKRAALLNGLEAVDTALIAAKLVSLNVTLDSLNRAIINAGIGGGDTTAFEEQAAEIEAEIALVETTYTDVGAYVAYFLDGSLLDGNLHPYTVYARATYPHWDGYSNTLPSEDRPSDFGTTTTDPAPDTFASWHSSYQAEWLNALGNGSGAVTTMNIGGTEVHYLLSQDGSTVLPVNTIETSEIAKLSQADQLALVGNPAVWSSLQDRLGLDSLADYNSGVVTIEALSGLVSAIASARSEGVMPSTDIDVFSKQVDLLEARIQAGGIVHVDLIAEAAGEIATRFDRALRFAEAPETSLVKVIFYDDGNLSSHADKYRNLYTDAAWNAYSSDDGETVGQGYDEFMRAERAVLASKLARASIAPVGGGFKDPRLDVPNLIYRLQSLYETEQEGVSDAGTEELLQLYALLDDYAIMQQMVNETIKAYDADATDQKRFFMNASGKAQDSTEGTNIRFRDYDDANVDSIRVLNGHQSGSGTIFTVLNHNSYGRINWFYSLSGDRGDGSEGTLAAFDEEFKYSNGMYYEIEGLSKEQMRVFSMFSNDSFTNSADADHPVELMYGIDRPLQSFVSHDTSGQDLALVKKSVWDQYSTQLSDAVTQLNQQVQIKQNEIDDASKQQNRHYELGANALSKMYDMLQSISSF